MNSPINNICIILYL